MRKLLCFSLFFIAFIPRVGAQANSVELKNGAGTVLGSYNAVTAAYAAIPATLSNAYIIELTAGYNGSAETFPINFTAKTGASTANTITLRPAAGVATVAITTSISTASSAVLILNDADYVVIDGRPGGTGTTRALTIGNTATGSNTVQLINGSCFDTVRYCILQNNSVGSAGRALHVSTSATNTSGNSDNYFEMIDVAGSRYGFNSNGTTANPNARNKLYGCDFRNVVFTGIWSQAGTSNITVDSCKFTCSSASATTPYGILFDSQSGYAELTRNTITDLQASGTSAIRGFYFRSTLTGSQSLVANNFISLTSANASSTSVVGIMYEGSNDTRADVAFNTIRIGGALSSGGTSGNVVSAALYNNHTAASNDFFIRNNIFINERTGGNSGTQHLAMALVSVTGTFVMDHNTYNSGTSSFVRSGTTVYNTVANWKTAAIPNEVNANGKTVLLVSATDLHLSGTSIGDVELKGAPVAGITTDIDNQIRNGIAPYRGADENITAPLPVNLLVFTASRQDNNAVLNWITASENNNQGFEIQRSQNGNEFNAVGFVAGAGNSNTRKEYDFTDVNIPAVDKLYYRLKQTDKDGHYQYSSICVVLLNNTKTRVEAYPNPFTGKTNLVIFTEKQQPALIDICDATGKKITGIQQLLIKGQNILTPSVLEGLNRGIYFVRVQTDGLIQTVTLIKQ